MRAAPTPVGPAHDEPDQGEHRGESDDDHRRHRREAVCDRLLVRCLRDLLGRSGEVPQLIHFRIPTMCVRLIRTELSVG